MTFLLSTMADDIGMQAVFNVIILIYGAFSIYTAMKMKKTGKPSGWLVNSKDLRHMKRTKEFCEEIIPKTILLGVICIIYGVFEMIQLFYMNSTVAELAGLGVFVVAVIWFFIALQRAKMKYTRYY